MASYLVLDCSYLLYRSHYAMRSLKYEGIPTGATFGFFRDLITFRELFDPDALVFCFDRGKGKRQELIPTYKSSRKKEWTEEEWEEHKELQRQMTNLRTKYLRRVGFKNILSQPGYEADDLIASIVRYSLTENDDAVIISSDGDLLQLLSHNTVLYNPAKKKCINAKSFRKEWGIEPCLWADVKALAGCISDDVIGIPSIGEKTASKWFSGKLSQESKKYKTINENLEVYNRNIKVIRLPFPGTEVFEIVEDKIDQNEWQKVMDEMGMSTIRNVTRSRDSGKQRV